MSEGKHFHPHFAGETGNHLMSSSYSIAEQAPKLPCQF